MDIRLMSINKSYNDNKVINDLTITLKDGCINFIMGPSGIGKTTILNILMGIVKPDAGEISGMGMRRIAAVFQEDRLIEHWDAIKNVRLTGEKTLSDDTIEQEFWEVGLEEYRKKAVSSLSGGMRRRVAIVRAMLAKSDTIFMDEPFQGLDEDLKKQVMDYVKKRTTGKTVIIVTHDRDEVRYLGGNLVVI